MTNLLRSSWIGILPFFMILFSGCLEYEDVDFKGVKNVSILERDESVIKIQVDVLVNNPNKFNIKVKKSSMDIYLNDKFAGKASLENKFVIEKRTEAVYAVILKANARDLMKAAMTNIGGMLKGNVRIGMRGFVKGSVYGIGKKVDVDMEESINLKDFM